MKKSIYEILSTVAENNNLTVVETTSERNGYPSNTSFSIIGFESTEQFHAVEQELNEALCLHKETEGNEDDEFLTVCAQDLHRRDGWNFWHRENYNVIQEVYDVKEVYDNKDNYVVWTCGECTDEEEFLNSEFKEIIDTCDTFQAARNLLDKIENLWQTLCDLEEGQIAVCGCEYCGTEVMDRYVMAYSYDTHNYTKALTIE